MKAPLSYVPALPAAIGIMAGIVIYYAGGSWIWCVAALIIAIAAIIAHRHWSAFLLIFISAGWMASEIDKPPSAPESLMGTKALWTGEVIAVKRTSGSTRLNVRIYQAKTADTCRMKTGPFICSLLLPTNDQSYRCSDIVSFNCRLRHVGSKSDLPDENSFNPTYFIDGVSAEAYVSPDDITIAGSVPTLRRLAEKWHGDLQNLIYLSPVNSETAWFLSATLLGDDSMLDHGVKQEFRATGVAHYLALSGFHVGIIAMIASLVFFPLKSWSRAGRYRHLIVIALIWFYTLICGMSASLIRAATLITIFLMAKVIGRQSSPYNSLAVASIVILVFSPRQLFAPGFQLSFAAVASILIFATMLNPFSRRRICAYRMAEFVSVPLAAMLGTCIVTMIHFHRFPLLFLLPNLLLAVLMPFMLGAGIVMMAATACGIKLSILGSASDSSYYFVETMCERLAALPHAEITGIFLPPLSIIAGIGAILLFAGAMKLKRRDLVILSTSALIICIGATKLQASPPETELFITRQPLRTDIIIRHSKECRLITSARHDQHDIIADQLSKRYSNYLSRRGCRDSITVADKDFDLKTIKRTGSYIVAGKRTIITAFDPAIEIATEHKADYLLISRSAGASPEKIANAAIADTVLIAADMPPKRAARLKTWCAANNIPTLDLSIKPFSFSIRE